MLLREYQQEAVMACLRDLEAHKRALLSLFTGGGKTVTAMTVMRSLGSALFVTNKIDLAVQSLDRWKQYFSNDQDAGLCVGSRGKYQIKPYTFATVQTAAKLDMSKFKLVVIDESHVELQEGEGYYKKLLDNCKDAAVLGLTATPFRTNRGYIYGKGKFYPRVSYEKNIKWGVEHGFLVEPRLKAGREQFDVSKVHTRMGDFDISELGQLAKDQDKLKAQVADAMERIDGRKCIAWSCVNIEHAEKVAQHLIHNFGQSALSYHSQTDGRDDELKAFRDGKYRHLTFVNTVSEGFDHPPLDTLVMMRPTRSPGMAIQQVGRTLRPYGDKKDALILDYGQVFKHVGPLDKPFIKGKGERMTKQDTASIAASLKPCPSCLEYVSPAVQKCPDCGHDFFEDKIKNVNIRPDFEASLFSEKAEKKIKWVKVGDVEAINDTARSGNKMIVVRFKKSVFDGPFSGYRMFIVTESWNAHKAREVISAICRRTTDWTKTSLSNCATMLNDSDVSDILVDETGQYPKIVRVRKADGREIFVA